MRIAAYIALVLGLGLAIVLIATHGFATVLAAMMALGAGVLLLPLIYVPHVFGAATSWSLLFRDGQRPPFPLVLRAIWIGISVETLLPLAGLAAEIAKARLMIRAGVKPRDAASLAVVDMTVQIVVLVFWAVIGTVALFAQGPRETLLWPAVAGAGVLSLAVLLLFYAQRVGLFGGLARLGARLIRSERRRAVVDGAAHLDRTVRAVYERPWHVVAAGAIRCTTRSVMAVELFAAAWLMGQPISATDAVMFIGIGGSIRAAAFILPGGWGLQEGAYIVLAQLIGITPDLALALSLASRVRELVIGVPALLLWQILEGHTLKNAFGRGRDAVSSELDPA